MADAVDVPSLLHRLGIEVVRDDGRELWALCPLHPDKDPSFQIRNDPGHEKNGWWRCFGCHEGGGPVALVRELLELRSDDAKEWIEGSRAKVPDTLEASINVLPTMRRFQLPEGVRIEPLERWITPARRYAERRGITAKQVKRWGLGYAVSGRLAHRLVIPVRDIRGRLLSYTSRTFVADEKRYLEPRKEEGAAQGAIFGEEHWPKLEDRRVVAVCEGSFDALAADRIVRIPIGAIMGSQIHPGHVSKLATFDHVLVAADPDRAGDAATEELISALVRYTKVERRRPPEGKDVAKLAEVSPRAVARLLSTRGLSANGDRDADPRRSGGSSSGAT